MAKLKFEKSTSDKILAAAKVVFMTKGMAGARMQDIANEAGINKALLHYYFRNKEQLFEVIFEQATHDLFPRINQIIDSDLPLFKRIELFCEEYITVMTENPYLPMFVMYEMHQNPERFIRKMWTKHDAPRPGKFLEVIEKEIQKGTIKKISPLHLLMNMLSLTIFPFVGKPLFQFNLKIDELQYRAIMEQRKTEIPRFIIDAIKKQ